MKNGIICSLTVLLGLGLIGFILPGCQSGPTRIEGIEAVPSKMDFDWIICGQTSMDEVQARLGAPSWSAVQEYDERPHHISWSFTWECSPFSYAPVEDPVWEWGEENAAKLAKYEPIAFDENRAAEEPLSDGRVLFEFIHPDVFLEEGETLSWASIDIDFDYQTRLVWHKSFCGPTALD